MLCSSKDVRRVLTVLTVLALTSLAGACQSITEPDQRLGVELAGDAIIEDDLMNDVTGSADRFRTRKGLEE